MQELDDFHKLYDSIILCTDNVELVQLIIEVHESKFHEDTKNFLFELCSEKF